MAIGLLFVCVLPSTVQSSVALTSMARGSIAGAICAATASPEHYSGATVTLRGIIRDLLKEH